MQPRRMLVLNTTENDNDLFYGRVFATGRATVAGDKGSVRMDIVATTDDDSAFFLPLSSKSNVARADFITFETPQQKADTLNILERKKLMFERKHKPQAIEGNSMDIDMTLNVRPNADFQLVIDPTVGDIIKGRGEGTLNLHINPRSNVFEMYGDYTITEGSYLFTLQNIINKRFIIENGSTIQWTGEPLDARLNINAVYKLKTSLQPLIGTSVSSGGGDMNLNRAVPVECIINLSDRLTHPTVTFDVKVPTADAEYQTIIANTLSRPSPNSSCSCSLPTVSIPTRRAAETTSALRLRPRPVSNCCRTSCRTGFRPTTTTSSSAIVPSRSCRATRSISGSRKA